MAVDYNIYNSHHIRHRSQIYLGVSENFGDITGHHWTAGKPTCCLCFGKKSESKFLSQGIHGIQFERSFLRDQDRSGDFIYVIEHFLTVSGLYPYF